MGRQLHIMMTPERIAAAMLLDLNFGKFGAKTTEVSQPLDLGPFLRY